MSDSSSEGWTTALVQDIASEAPHSIAIGPFGSRLKAELYVDEGFPVIRGQDIGPGKNLLDRNLVYVPDAIADSLSSCVVVQGDLIFPHRGAIGQVGIVGGRSFLLSSSMMKLTCNQDLIDPEYLFYYFRGPGRDELLTRASTVGTPGIGQPLKSLRGIPVRYPRLSQQRAIAEVLGALDDKIAVNTMLIDAAQKLAITLISDRRPSVSLSEVVVHRKKTIAPDGISDALVEHFSLPAFDQNAMPERVSPTEIKSSKFVIERPSVLVSKLNPRFPRVWDVQKIPVLRALASTEFLVLEPLYSSTTVLWAMLLQPAFGSSLQGKVAGTSGSHQRVKPSDLLETLVVDPRDLEDKLCTTVTAAGAAVSSARNENVKLAATRDALLPQLMSGAIRIKDAEKAIEEVV